MRRRARRGGTSNVMSVITVSRQFGSYGDAIVDLICEGTGYRSLDKNLMLVLAKDAGLKPAQVARLSEETYRPRGMMERFFANAGPWTRHPAIWAGYGGFIAGQLLAAEAVTQLIQAAYQRGKIVIVGRGGQVVLRDKPDVLHVRIIAPLELRVRRHRVRAGLTAEAAREAVLEADRASAEFVERTYGADVADPALYDLIINTGNVPLAVAAELVVGAKLSDEGCRLIR